MSKEIDFLYYNCENPQLIIDSLTIKTSKIHTGVSMTTSDHMISHGPFRIKFNRAVWFNQFEQIKYGDDLGQKTTIFADEEEWYSKQDVRFSLNDVVEIIYMVNAPIIRPIVTKRIRNWLANNISDYYRECVVFDPKYPSRI